MREGGSVKSQIVLLLLKTKKKYAAIITMQAAVVCVSVCAGVKREHIMRDV